MLSQEVEERLTEYLINRIEEQNTFIYKKIGNTIKTMSKLIPSEAYQLSQILKYGGTYEEIAQELAKVSGKNVQDIYKIFEEVAKENKRFAKDFYKYRGIDYIPYKNDIELQNRVKAISALTANNYMNISNTTSIGFLFENTEGQMYFKNIQESYYEIVDRGILAITQGKSTFQEEMRKIIEDVGTNGVVLYESGRTRRVDSAVRMNLLDGIRQLNNENSIRFGEQYDADGVEISVHSNPAPDHAEAQGRQFSLEEYEKLQNGEVARDYEGKEIQLGHSKKGSYRPISQWNCYHKIFSIVLGVNKPEYTDEQLNDIQESNISGFEFEGRHYTMYQRNTTTKTNRNRNKKAKR